MGNDSNFSVDAWPVVRDALDRLGQGIAIYDSEFHLVDCNKAFCNLLDLPPEMAVPGTHISVFIRLNAELQYHGEGSIGSLIEGRMSRLAKFPLQTFERQSPDGRVIEIRHIRTTSGGLVSTYLDITEHARARDALKQSESRFQKALAGSREAVWDWNVTTDEVYLSARWASMLGFSEDEMSPARQKLEQLIHDDDIDRVTDAVRANLFQHQPYDIEYRVRHRRGHYVWIRSRGEAEWSEDGTPVRMSGIATDISRRRSAEDALRDSERRLRQVTDSLPALIASVGQDKTIRFANRTAGLWLDCESPTLVGRPAMDLFPAAKPASVEQNWKGMIASGQQRTTTERFVWADGKQRDIELTLIPHRSANDSFTGAFVQCVDLTSFRESERRLQRLQKMEAMGQLTGGIAHDFNNLLAIITGHSELLAEMLEDQPKATRSLDAVLRAASRGSALIQRLLTFARRQDVNRTIVDVNHVVSSLTEVLERLLGETITIGVRLEKDLWPVELDAGLLEDAIINMAINARDAMENGGELTLTSVNSKAGAKRRSGQPEPTRDYVVLSISDSGSGMPQEVQDRAFEPFFTTKSFGAGSGLGLSMVYGFTREAGGVVTIDSQPGKGTTISLWFPRQL